MRQASHRAGHSVFKAPADHRIGRPHPHRPIAGPSPDPLWPFSSPPCKITEPHKGIPPCIPKSSSCLLSSLSDSSPVLPDFSVDPLFQTLSLTHCQPFCVHGTEQYSVSNEVPMDLGLPCTTGCCLSSLTPHCCSG